MNNLIESVTTETKHFLSLFSIFYAIFILITWINAGVTRWIYDKESILCLLNQINSYTVMLRGLFDSWRHKANVKVKWYNHPESCTDGTDWNTFIFHFKKIDQSITHIYFVCQKNCIGHMILLLIQLWLAKIGKGKVRILIINWCHFNDRNCAFIISVKFNFSNRRQCTVQCKFWTWK